MGSTSANPAGKRTGTPEDRRAVTAVAATTGEPVPRSSEAAWAVLSPAAERQLRLLGERLGERDQEVLVETLTRTLHSGDPSGSKYVRESFERIGSIATQTIAGWM